MRRIRTATVAALLATLVVVQPSTALGSDDQGNGNSRRHRIEQEERREEKRERAEAKRDYREAARDARYREQQRNYWDASRYYRNEANYRERRLSRNDWIYRGSDNRYYCSRDDGTTGLIIGGVAGAVLGNVLVPGGAKVLGTIIGGGAGALIGKAIDDGDIQCR